MNAAPMQFSEEDGHRLAVDMLLEMESLGMDELTLDGAEEYRGGRPQSDILVRYLRAAQADKALEAGFLAVLTDVLGGAAEGGAAVGLYESWADR